MFRRLSISGMLLAFLACADVTLGSSQAAQWGQGYLPNVPVVTQDGTTVRFFDDVMKGKITVISFIYTSCRDICPVVTARLAQVQDKLGSIVGRDVFFVSISIDPENDTPQKLKEYAEAFGAGPGWTFLTGNPADMDLIRYKLGERSRKLAEHGNAIMLYNDATSEWSRDSAFSDLNVLALTIRSMDPAWRNAVARQDDAKSANATPAMVSADPSAELPGQTLFVKTCGACHTIGRGDKIGPDLAGVSTRRSRDWIVSYLVDPQKMRAKGDPAALALATKYKAVRMPGLSLSDNDASDLISYVDAMTYAKAADGADPHSHPAHH
jgi:protein SCO1/2